MTLQFVVLHAMVSPDGHLSDAEVLASSDSSKNQHALDRLANWQNRPMMRDAQQPGTAPQSHELFFTFQFAVPAGS
ncbi:MAG: energy transducer TonB [Acidobacteriaceae bacterium]|nr:energy transducer TonB [Acidobacteriaceae bacterium]